MLRLSAQSYPDIFEVGKRYTFLNNSVYIGRDVNSNHQFILAPSNNKDIKEKVSDGFDVIILECGSFIYDGEQCISCSNRDSVKVLTRKLNEKEEKIIVKSAVLT